MKSIKDGTETKQMIGKRPRKLRAFGGMMSKKRRKLLKDLAEAAEIVIQVIARSAT